MHEDISVCSQTCSSGFQPQGRGVTTAMPSLRAPSRLAAATVIVWPPEQPCKRAPWCRFCTCQNVRSVSRWYDAHVICIHISCCCLLPSCMSVCGWTCSCDDVPPLSVEARCACRGMCDFDNLPIQPGAAVICCLVSVCAVQEPHLRRESWQGGFGLLMALSFHLPRFFPGEQTAPCWLLTTAEKRPVKAILS